MDPSSASYYPSVFFHTHKKSNAGRNTLSRSTIPNDQGDHEPKVKGKLKMEVCILLQCV